MVPRLDLPGEYKELLTIYKKLSLVIIHVSNSEPAAARLPTYRVRADTYNSLCQSSGRGDRTGSENQHNRANTATYMPIYFPHH